MVRKRFSSESLGHATSRPVRWLWKNYLPRGKLAILDGDPGTGKSLLSLDLASRLSRGGPLPDGSDAGEPRRVLVLSAEDSLEDTILPRAESAGADLGLVGRVVMDNGCLMQFPDDLGGLQDEIFHRKVDFLIVDPFAAFIQPTFAASSEQSMRWVLGLFSRVAERTDCTVLLIRHLRKKESARAVCLGLGSIAIIGAVRTGLLAAHHPTEAGQHVLAVTKSNLAEKPPSLGYRIVTRDSGVAAIEWTGPLDLPADSLDRIARPLFPRDRAAGWLVRELAAGPRKASELLEAAAGAKIPERTLYRAKEDAGVESRKVQTENGMVIAYWYDPAAPWPENAPFKRSDEGPMFDF